MESNAAAIAATVKRNRLMSTSFQDAPIMTYKRGRLGAGYAPSGSGGPPSRSGWVASGGPLGGGALGRSPYPALLKSVPECRTDRGRYPYWRPEDETGCWTDKRSTVQ